MNLEKIITEGGIKLKDSKDFAEAVIYLTEKFKNKTNEEVKKWIAEHGTWLKKGQIEWVKEDARKMGLTDTMLIWNIEEVLDLLQTQL